MFLIGLILTTSCTQQTTTYWDYERFINAVEQGQIRSIRISGDQSQVLLTDPGGEEVIVNLPSNSPELIETLAQYNVDLTFASGQSQFDQRNNKSIFRAVIAILIALLPTLIWVWALVDCANQEENGSNVKLLWILIIIFTSVVGSIAYLAIRRPQRRRELGQ